MNIIELKDRQNISSDIKLTRIYSQFGELLRELKKKELSQNIIKSINEGVEKLNSSSLTGNELRKLVKQEQTKALKQVEKELKIIPKSYYQNLWMTVGMSVFGVPIGVVFGLSMGNIGLMAVGLPIGMGIGIAVGLVMDKKALEEGRQLNLEIKY
jgi:hypothetical protein